MFSLKCRSAVAAVKGHVRHSKPTWPERTDRLLAAFLRRGHWFSVCSLACAVGKSGFSYAHKSKEDNLFCLNHISPGR